MSDSVDDTTRDEQATQTESSDGGLSRRSALSTLATLGVLGIGSSALTGSATAQSVRTSGAWTVDVDGEKGLRLAGPASFTDDDGNQFTGSGNVRFGHLNTIADETVGATVSGGGLYSHRLDRTTGNEVTAHFGTVSGGAGNRAGGDGPRRALFSTVSGGFRNDATGSRSTVGGGNSNEASGRRSTVAGGNNNNATGDTATVAGGLGNDATGDNATVAGGAGNAATDKSASVGGGRTNIAGGRFGAIGGGHSNRAAGEGAAVPGGYNNVADGDYSYAVGRQAKASGHDGALVFADSSNDSHTAKTDDAAFFQMPVYAESFNTTSTRTAKTAVDTVDPESVLDGVDSLDVRTWEFTDSDGQHMGPMAEEFSETFDLGADEESIATVDADGVALAAIQGLSERLERKDDRIDELAATVEQKDDRIDDLERRLAALEKKVDES